MNARIKALLIAFGFMGAVGLAPAVPVAAAPIDVFKPCTTATTESGRAFCNNQADQKLFGPNSIWTRIINTLLLIVGALAVVMIVIGGLRYVTSGGDSGSVSSAKNTVLYSVVGLVVASLAYTLVNFVIVNI